MSRILGRNYRLVVENAAGVTVGCVINARRFKFAADGSRSDEAAETEVFNIAAIASGSTGNGAAIDNSVDKYLGGDLEITVTPGASATGTVKIYLAHSTDGGVSWGTQPGDWIKTFAWSASAAGQSDVARVGP